MHKSTNKPPSEVIDLPTHIRREFGFNEWYVCMCFDQAVIYFGSQIENKLNEYDKKGKPKNTLEGLLRMPVTGQEVTRLSRDNRMIGLKPKRKVKK